MQTQVDNYDRPNWCDDDRNPVVRSVRPKTRTNSPDRSIATVCREIIRDIDNEKVRLLWNEVEHVNYVFEFADASDEENSSMSDIPSDKPCEKATSEVNPKCFDVLVKNQTAYM